MVSVVSAVSTTPLLLLEHETRKSAQNVSNAKRDSVILFILTNLEKTNRELLLPIV